MKSKKILSIVLACSLTFGSTGILSQSSALASETSVVSSEQTLASTLHNQIVDAKKSIKNENFTTSDSNISLSAKGGKFETSGDSFNYSSIPVTGDFTATAKLSSLTNITSKSKAFLMVRNGSDSTSPHISLGAKKLGTGAYEARLSKRSNGNAKTIDANTYFRISREGTTYTLSTSSEKSFANATLIKTFKADGSSKDSSILGNAGSTLNVGLAVADCNAVFDYFTVTDGSGNLLYNLADASNTNPDKPAKATIASIDKLNDVTFTKGQPIVLPTKVTANYSDGSKAEVPVTWDTVNTNLLGIQKVNGTVEEFSNGISINVTIKDIPVVTQNSIYVSPEASDSGTGTINDPMSLTSAVSNVTAGGTIYVKGGTYKFSKQFTIPYTNNGSENDMKSIVALNGEKVTLDFSDQPYDMKNPANNSRGLQLEGSYWYVKGIEFFNAADNGLYVTGKHNKIELCVARANRDTGIQISRRSSTLSNKADWPSDNLILNCTSFNNSDPATGENADGFAAKLTCGDGNIFDGCISYNNVDDGWDLYTKAATGEIGAVTIRNCVAFRNGSTTTGQLTKNSDGNGFKMGGSKMHGNHVLYNCISFENKNHGFTDNSNPGTITVDSCTSFNNSLADGGKSNFDFARDKTNSNNIFRNLISFSNKKVSSDKYRGTAENCVFSTSNKTYMFTTKATADSNVGELRGTPTDAVTANDFVSIDAPALGTDVHTLWRNADGSINMGNFLKITPNSTYNTMGAHLHK
ncbi:Ig-like domain-containing protein [Clostridium sp. HBUAS56017]|uniref:right-handed parallel beta-helix repeat-containing protein n=1 Tax=Clostridium sp. HBUAS56017 TaxID=2571128 RepID=UPI001178A877|nr:Ig-like domain-containing protein [Clostridium sp. HBUAS56017]